jgi:hypothetical protein
MRINPEFRRNVWVQFTWTRLVAAPLLTIIACYGYLQISGQNYRLLQTAAELIGGGVIIGLLGTRRAADSLAEEVSGGTWDSQRMSGLGAWQMTWGKLIGSTAFNWYCAAIAVLIVLWTSNRIEALGGIGRPAFEVIFDFAGGGLMAQAAAFAIALILMRKAARYRRLTITLAQSCGFLLYFFFVRGGFSTQSPARFHSDAVWLGGSVTWYGAEYPTQLFRIAVLGFACAWAVVGAYRLMRNELQYRSQPWIWTLFLVFCVVLVAGFPPSPHLGFAFVALVVLTYGAFFADNRDPVRYRWALQAVRDRNWPEAFSSIPWWLISYVFAAVVGIIVALSLPANIDVGFIREDAPPAFKMAMMIPQHLSTSLVLVLLFLLRDLLVMLWFSCSPWRAKADVAGIIYLALAYWPLAAILWVAGGQHLLPVVVPIATGNIGTDFVPIAIELAFASFLFYARWKEITQLRQR